MDTHYQVVVYPIKILWSVLLKLNCINLDITVRLCSYVQAIDTTYICWHYTVSEKSAA